MTGSVSMPAVVAMLLLLLLLALLAPLLPLLLLLPPPPPLPPPPFMACPLAVGESRPLPLWCAWIGGLFGSPENNRYRLFVTHCGCSYTITRYRWRSGGCALPYAI